MASKTGKVKRETRVRRKEEEERAR